MWMVTFDLNKYQVDVLYDKDSGEVTHYCNNGENDFFNSCKENRFFELEKMQMHISDNAWNSYWGRMRR